MMIRLKINCLLVVPISLSCGLFLICERKREKSCICVVWRLFGLVNSPTWIYILLCTQANFPSPSKTISNKHDFCLVRFIYVAYFTEHLKLVRIIIYLP